jgi:hypothetical protein
VNSFIPKNGDSRRDIINITHYLHDAHISCVEYELSLIMLILLLLLFHVAVHCQLARILRAELYINLNLLPVNDRYL